MREKTGIYEKEVEQKYDRMLSLGGDWGDSWNVDGKTKWVNWEEEEEELEEMKTRGLEARERVVRGEFGQGIKPWISGFKNCEVEVRPLTFSGPRRIGKSVQIQRGKWRDREREEEGDGRSELVADGESADKKDGTGEEELIQAESSPLKMDESQESSSSIYENDNQFPTR